MPDANTCGNCTRRSGGDHVGKVIQFNFGAHAVRVEKLLDPPAADKRVGDQNPTARTLRANSDQPDRRQVYTLREPVPAE